jgi:uncharacterized damage-inducible protein DinB
VREVDRLRRVLEATVEGDPWYGSAIRRILEGVEASHAAARPIDGAHTIWELVAHMTAWTNEVNRRLRGGPHADPAEGDWPAITSTSAESWQSAQSALARAHASLAATLTAMDDADLAKQIAGGQVDAAGHPVSLYDTSVGLLQHDAYHAGQIALLKKALGLGP